MSQNDRRQLFISGFFEAIHYVQQSLRLDLNGADGLDYVVLK
ncbi:hypothetical protein [Pseudomonas fluorescens]|nr:hypothetical protein [Pseudomonas fluorescens]